ncbi:MAG: F0F1 ATP synthase subunit B [Patescibacteria group bacterium]
MEALGIDLKLMIAQVVNFGILFFLLSKFAYKPIVKMIEERQTKVEQGLKDAEAAGKSRSEAEIDAEKIREQAYKDANEILKNAKEAANLEAGEIVKKASEQADRIMLTAKEEAASSKSKVLTEAKGEISSLIITALDKIVGKEIDSAQKEKLTRKAISEL